MPYSGLGRGGLGLFPAALRGLDDQTHLDGLGADLDALGHAVDDGADGLDVGHELAVREPGDLGADAAEVLGLTAGGLLAPELGLLAGEKTNAGHDTSS